MNVRHVLFELLFTAVLLSALQFRLLAQAHDTTGAAVAPTFLEKPELEYPKEAEGASVTGKLWVKLMINRDGIPVKTEIMKRDPEMAFMFDDAARHWAMSCRFTPAKDSVGNPVAVWISIPLRFKLEDFQPPAVTRLATPEYPEEAKAMGMEGWVGVAVLVGEMGVTVNSKAVVVARDPPFTKVFDEAAKVAAKASEYTVATYLGKRTNGWCFVKITFTLN